MMTGVNVLVWTAITENYLLGGFNKHLFLTALEAGSPHP